MRARRPFCPSSGTSWQGAERAHSLVMNPHKWLFTPVDLSAFYTRRPDILRRAFSLVPEYLMSPDDPRAVNLMEYGVPLGPAIPRVEALVHPALLRPRGRSSALRAHIQWAQELAGQVDADPRFERAAPTPFSVVCFRFKGTDEQNRTLMDRVNASGRGLSLAHRSARPVRAADRDRQPGHHPRRRAGSLAPGAEAGGRHCSVSGAGRGTCSWNPPHEQVSEPRRGG